MSLFLAIRAKRQSRILKTTHQQGLGLQLVRLLLILTVLLILHSLAMIYFEGLPFYDALWLSLTTATTVGYGDYSAQSLFGRLSTVILIYGAGITLLAQAAAYYIEYRQERHKMILNGNWSWKMQDHIVFINSPRDNAEDYFIKAISQLRTSSSEMAEKSVIIACTRFQTLPERLRQIDVAYVNRTISDPELIEAASLDKAAVITVLSQDAYNFESDSISFDAVSRAREVNENALIIAESVSDNNRSRLHKAGADHVVRPIRSYPELLVRTIIAPGAEQIIEDLFDSRGEECMRYNVEFKSTWSDLVKVLIDKDIGTLIAYNDHQGNVVPNTKPGIQVEGCALFVITREKNRKTDHIVQNVLKDYNCI